MYIYIYVCHVHLVSVFESFIFQHIENVLKHHFNNHKARLVLGEVPPPASGAKGLRSSFRGNSKREFSFTCHNSMANDPTKSKGPPKESSVGL